MADRAYRGGNHPPYCTCHKCTELRSKGRKGLGAPRGSFSWVSSLLRALKLKR